MLRLGPLLAGSALLRALLILWGVVQDGLSRVPYTDVDYKVGRRTGQPGRVGPSPQTLQGPWAQSILSWRRKQRALRLHCESGNALAHCNRPHNPTYIEPLHTHTLCCTGLHRRRTPGGGGWLAL